MFNYHKIMVFAVILACPILTANESYDADEEKSVSSDSTRKAVLSYRYADHGVILTMTNAGNAPFVLDEHLVIGIRWGFYDEEMKPLHPAAVGESKFDRSAPRLKLLRPNESLERTVRFDRPIRLFDGATGQDVNQRPIISAGEMTIAIPEAARYARVGYWLLYPVSYAAHYYLAGHDPRDNLFTDCTPSLLIDLGEVDSFTQGLCRKTPFGHRPILPAAAADRLMP